MKEPRATPPAEPPKLTSPATANREIAILARMGSLARRQYGLTVPFVVETLKERNAREAFFEEAAFRAVSRLLRPELAALATVGNLTGWRKSELRSRQWRHVDFAAGWLRLEPEETKNREGRMFPLIPELRTALRCRTGRRPASSACAAVVHSTVSRSIGSRRRCPRFRPSPASIRAFRRGRARRSRASAPGSSARGASSAPAWDPARLGHALDVIGVAPVTGGTVALAADPGSDGDFDWDAFHQREGDAPAAGALPPVTTNTTSIIPTVVRFRGMPNARWWTFENGTVDFGDIRPEKRDLARLNLMDFMLIHGNDWFLVPVEVPVGTLCRIDALIVRDVFGEQTLVERADAGSAPAGARWTMFSTAIQGAADRVADFLVVPSSAATALQVGTAIEEARLLRDEVANMAWAIEQVTANGLGDAWPGHERDQRLRAAEPAPPPAAPDGPPLRYLLQTRVPEHWHPLLPVAIDAARGQIALELGAMLRPVPSGAAQPVLPVGRFLRPTRLAGAAYRIREEEVPRAGARVSRLVCRTRWHDGSTHVWVQRIRAIGAGEGSSRLRFDLAVLQKPAGPA
jgi:hypothetical protein